MHKSNYEVNVLVNGKPVREYYQDGKFYIEARQNTEYSIKLKNHGHKKIMAVISVDGIDVLKGKNATEAESGYIVNPYSTTEIKGYRIDDDKVATFKFDDGKKSYSTQVEQKFDKKKLEKVQKGQIAPSKNNGVIGVRIWEEKEPMEIPEWKTERYKPNKNKFYGHYSYHDRTDITGCSFGSFSSFSGCLSTTGGLMGAGLYCSGAGIGPNNLSYNPMNITTDNIDWTEWEIDTPRVDVNQFGNLEAIDRIDLPPIKLKRRQKNRIIYQSDQIYVGDVPARGFIPNYTPNFELGTTWGKQEEDKIVKVQFIKADTFIDLEIFYLKRDELIKLGIDLDNAKKIFISGYPKAFGDKEDYCKEPINWRKQ